MKIAIIGSHGTGKTTICNEFIKKHPEYFLIPEIARVFGIEKIEKCIDVQKEMFLCQKFIENRHKNFIADRSLLDFGIYSMNHDFIKECKENIRYDYIFYIPIRFNLVNDRFRNLDENFRRKIDDLFQKHMPYNTIIIKSLNINERIKEIEQKVFI